MSVSPINDKSNLSSSIDTSMTNSNRNDGGKIDIITFDSKKTTNITVDNKTNINSPSKKRAREKTVELIEINGKKVSKTSQGKRKFHNKSKNGCLNCKKRRVKCDEMKPICQKCINMKLDCSYAIDLTNSHNNSPPINNNNASNKNNNIQDDKSNKTNASNEVLNDNKKKSTNIVKYITKKTDGTVQVVMAHNNNNNNDSINRSPSPSIVSQNNNNITIKREIKKEDLLNHDDLRNIPNTSINNNNNNSNNNSNNSIHPTNNIPNNNIPDNNLLSLLQSQFMNNKSQLSKLGSLLLSKPNNNMPNLANNINANSIANDSSALRPLLAATASLLGNSTSNNSLTNNFNSNLVSNILNNQNNLQHLQNNISTLPQKINNASINSTSSPMNVNANINNSNAVHGINNGGVNANISTDLNINGTIPSILNNNPQFNSNNLNSHKNGNTIPNDTKQQVQYHLNQQLQLQQHQQIQLQQNQEYHLQQQQLQLQQQQFLQQLLEQDLTQQTQSSVDQSVLLSSQLQQAQAQAQAQLSMSPITLQDDTLVQINKMANQSSTENSVEPNPGNNMVHGNPGRIRSPSSGFPTAGIGGIVYDFQELLGLKINNNGNPNALPSKVSEAEEALATMQEETERNSREARGENTSNKLHSIDCKNGHTTADMLTPSLSSGTMPNNNTMSVLSQLSPDVDKGKFSQTTTILSPDETSSNITSNKYKNKHDHEMALIPRLLSLSTKANLNLVDMKLFHHYCTEVSSTITTAQVSVPEVWGKDVPELAFEYPFLMHSLLAFSATHLSRTEPGLEQYVSSHRLDALRLLREAVLEISDNNTDALVASALILIMDSLANATNGIADSNGNIPASSASSSAWIFHVKGAATILTAVWPLSESSRFYDLISVDLSDLGDVINEQDGTVSELVCFDESISELYPVDINSPYFITLAYLDKLNSEIDNSNFILRVFAFPALLDKTFLALLMTGDINAMRIMRCYYTLLRDFTTKVKDQVWFLEGVSKVLPQDVDEYSGGGGMHMMLDFLGGGLPSMTATDFSDFIQ